MISNQIGQAQKWKEYDSSIYYLSLPETEGIDFLGQIAAQFDSTFQELIREISGQITGKTVFWLNGKRVECKFSISKPKRANKFKPYNRLWILFFERSNGSVLWTDQGAVKFVFEKEIVNHKRNPSLEISWNFENYCVSVSREVKHNRGFCTPSCLKIQLPMDYSDSPDVLLGIKAEGGKLEIGYPFVLEPDRDKIIVPSCFFPKTSLLQYILDDISQRGVEIE